MASVCLNTKLFARSMTNTFFQKQIRFLSSRVLTNEEVRKKRVDIFEKEQARQYALVTRVEKIEVKHTGVPEECSLIMNKYLSTPFNCAMHMQELLTKQSALALVNGEPWDMHRPLESDCELKFLHFEDEDPRIANEAFWKSCSFVLGHVLETAFQDKFYVQLCSFPPPNIASGSFVYDADLNLGDWKPSNIELNCLSRIGLRLNYSDFKFQRLEVPVSVAEEMFSDNRFKTAQIPPIAEKSKTGTSVTVYRMGDHIDISSGPLISSTSQIGRFSVCAIHDIESPSFGKLKRVQGVALPTQLMLHSWTYDTILRPRAGKPNPGPVPTLKNPQKNTEHLSAH
ncbi:large ribosomal subunit protein mL39-like [Physella acuta]|uniref:large ribosomal subunit protein mL39-like n=1 Tax=Physella acuta TaxID=109671 RepID=UPI0027DC3055|nr:large ribosomal subunit protein mL39-like [Physella acuta]